MDDALALEASTGKTVSGFDSLDRYSRVAKWLTHRSQTPSRRKRHLGSNPSTGTMAENRDDTDGTYRMKAVYINLLGVKTGI